jgi:hypothetical protein
LAEEIKNVDPNHLVMNVMAEVDEIKFPKNENSFK